MPLTMPGVDGNNIDFVEGTNTPDTCRSVIMSVPKTGGGSKQISPGTSGIDAWMLVKDDKYVYWPSTNRNGAIFRLEPDGTPEMLASQQLTQRSTSAQPMSSG